MVACVVDLDREEKRVTFSKENERKWHGIDNDFELSILETI